MCTSAAGGDVEINVVSFSPINYSLSHLFHSSTLKKRSASILVTARNIHCTTKMHHFLFAKESFQENVYPNVFRTGNTKGLTNWTQDESLSFCISQWQSKNIMFFFTLQLHYLSLNIARFSSGTFTVYLAVQSCRTEPCWEQKVTWHTEACVLCIPALAWPPLCSFIPPHSLLAPWRLKKNIPDKLKAYLTLNVLVFRLLCHSFPPFCDVIFVKQVFQSQEKELKNNGVRLNGWLSLIPWLNHPLLWS